MRLVSGEDFGEGNGIFRMLAGIILIIFVNGESKLEKNGLARQKKN